MSGAFLCIVVVLAPFGIFCMERIANGAAPARRPQLGDGQPWMGSPMTTIVHADGPYTPPSRPREPAAGSEGWCGGDAVETYVVLGALGRLNLSVMF